MPRYRPPPGDLTSFRSYLKGRRQYSEPAIALRVALPAVPPEITTEPALLAWGLEAGWPAEVLDYVRRARTGYADARRVAAARRRAAS